MKLLNSCPRLTHLSLTGVQAFLRHDLEQFCRDAPNGEYRCWAIHTNLLSWKSLADGGWPPASEFTDHQRQVFCVFSGTGVVALRRHLNTTEAFAHLRDTTPTGIPRQQQNPVDFGYDGGPVVGHGHGAPDATFDDAERDVVEDDDGLDDGSEMMIDTAPPAQNDAAQEPGGASLDASMIPPPPPAPPLAPSHAQSWHPQVLHNYSDHVEQPHYQPQGLAHTAPLANGVPFLGATLSASTDFQTHQPGGQPHPHLADAMDTTSTQPMASTAPLGSNYGSGPSTASMSAAQANNAIGRTLRSQHTSPNGDENHGSSSSSSPEAS